MSAMSELHILISDRLERGDLPEAIAQELDIPVSWVFEVIEDANTSENS